MHHTLLQVLLACIKCPGGWLLTNDNVINIFQACFRIGHNDAHKVPNGACTAHALIRPCAPRLPACAAAVQLPLSAQKGKNEK